TVRRFYAYRLLSEARFESAIWIIYLRSRGLSLTEIGLAESAFHLAPILLEIPSGSFADLAGRRWSLATSAGLVAASAALLWSAHAFPVAAAALFLNGASYSFRSGADQAYLYDALREGEAEPAGYVGILGRLLGASYLVGACATWLGAALSEASYGYTFALAIGAGLAGLWLAAGLAERPRRGTRAEGSARLRGHAGEMARALRARPAVAAMLALSAVYWTALTVAQLYFQAAFAARGLSNARIGFVLALVLLINAAGAAAAGRLHRVGPFRAQFVALAGVTGVGLLGTAVAPLGPAIAAYLVAQGASGLIEPLVSGWYNERLPAALRATLLSVESWRVCRGGVVAIP
ncbi:MAG: MFS transporter, partial [Thermomicrobiaceae bacterium]|nr:MFS transporter [Thermomicrobiaceae bacterium]